MLKLYDYFRSSACFRVRIALYLKDLSFRIQPIHLVNNQGEQYSEHYQSINPQALVPTLEDNGKIITQSLAIIEYLDETYEAPPLLPSDPYQKALVRSFAASIAADLHPLNNLRVLNFLTKEMNLNETQKLTWYRHWMSKGLHALEKQLQSHPFGGKFCFGDSPTLADLCLVPQLYNARRFDCDINPYPTLVRVDAHCQEHPAFQKAWPEASSHDAN